VSDTLFKDDERLFVGRQISDKWYNYFRITKPERLLDILDTKEDSFVSLASNLIKKCVKSIYTEQGEEYKLRDDENVNDYLEFKYEDIQAIAWRAMKEFKGQDYAFDEYMFCDVCTRGKRNPQYHKIAKSWDALYKKGEIVINYLKEYDGCKWSVTLKNPIEIEGEKFYNLKMEIPSFKDMMEIHAAVRAGEITSEVEQKYAYTTLAIKEVEGLKPSILTTYKRKNGIIAFAKNYIKTDEDFELIDKATPSIGFDPSMRFEYCKCGNKLVGMDFANFFLFLGYNKKSQNREK